MKKLFCIIASFLLAATFAEAQPICETVSAETYREYPQPTGYNTWGLVVNLERTVKQDVTVQGSIRAVGARGGRTFSLIVTAGTLSAQTIPAYFRTEIGVGVEITVSSVSTCPEPFASAEAIFKNVNHAALQTAINANDEEGAKNLMYPLANDIAGYVLKNYGENISDEIEDFPEATVMLGLLLYAKENNFPDSIYTGSTQQGTSRLSKTFPQITVSTGLLVSLNSWMNWLVANKRTSIASTPFDCFFSALGSLVGITTIVDIYRDFKSGASPRTILRAVKAIGKRSFLAISVGISIISLGNCLDWW